MTTRALTATEQMNLILDCLDEEDSEEIRADLHEEAFRLAESNEDAAQLARIYGLPV